MSELIEKFEELKITEDRDYFLNCRGTKIQISKYMVDKIGYVKDLFETDEKATVVFLDISVYNMHDVLDFLLGENEAKIEPNDKLKSIMRFLSIDYEPMLPKKEVIKEIKKEPKNIIEKLESQGNLIGINSSKRRVKILKIIKDMDVNELKRFNNNVYDIKGYTYNIFKNSFNSQLLNNISYYINQCLNSDKSIDINDNSMQLNYGQIDELLDILEYCI